MRVVVITSSPRGNAARVVDYLARKRPPGVVLAGAVVDRGTRPDRRRQAARLRAWRRHGGASYAVWRACLELRSRVRPRPRAEYFRSLAELGSEHRFPVLDTPNINSSEAIESLAGLRPDLAVSIGNRVIAEEVFSVPPMGAVNLHHGRIPAYRGGPPAFWELYDGRDELGVSVHRIDARLDHGELLAETTVPLLPTDDLRAAMERALGVDYKLLETVLVALAAGTLRQPEPDASVDRLNTLPSRSQLVALRRRLGRRVDVDDYRLARLEPIELPVEPPLNAPAGASR